MPQRRSRKLAFSSMLVVATFAALACSGSSERANRSGEVSIVLRPSVGDGASDRDVDSKVLSQAAAIIAKRLKATGTDADVTVRGKRIVVRLPDAKNEERILALVTKTGELRFRPVLQDLGAALDATATARIAELRRQLRIPEGVSALQVYNAEVAARKQATTPGPVETTTTTIDPAPRNEYGVAVYWDEYGQLNPEFRELAGLEQQAQQAELGLTLAKDDIADKEVVLADADGNRYRLGPTKLTGKAVETADEGLDQSGQWEVRPTFRASKEGIDLFNAAAAICYAGQPECPQLGGREHGAMAIVLDSVVLTAPSINESSFARNQITISGGFTEQKAKEVAIALRYGSLPIALEPE